MKKLIVCSLVLFGACLSSAALADEANNSSAYHPDISSSQHKFAIGAGLGVGVPEGITAGVVVSPFLRWLKIEAGVSENVISPGLFIAPTFDFFNSPVSLTFTPTVGGSFPGKVPGVHNSPDLSYTYEDLALGLEIGRQNGFRFYLRGGAAHINANAMNFNGSFTLPTGSTIGDPSLSAWMPSAKIGFQWLF